MFLFVLYGLVNDLKFNGFIIFKDVFFILNLYFVFFDEKIFLDLYDFKFERFLDEKGNFKNIDKVLVFLFGK